ncbi:hypothetical protein BT96DRAFT_1087970 [Gymnopus androsaceus JB14]|uniref:Uncharacterized protein n=1 Tax=Gymnopus androsaceus JB14 TaxID=1447944 RepID=A0A6A4GJU8_9AGAR|nr:hypothetical protein BT96DRAFT_1087970 [Gymnopus androsaceus JB14]
MVANEVKWFFTPMLGIDDTYFRDDPKPVICEPHYCAFLVPKCSRNTKHDPSKLVIDARERLTRTEMARLLFIPVPLVSLPTEGPGAACESRLETFITPVPFPRLLLQQRQMLFMSTSVSFQTRCHQRTAEGRTVSDKSFWKSQREKEVFEAQAPRGLSIPDGAELPPSFSASPTSTTFYSLYALANTWNSSLIVKRPLSHKLATVFYDQLVFVDEAANNQNTTKRKYAWSPIGTRAQQHDYFVRGKWCITWTLNITHNLTSVADISKTWVVVIAAIASYSRP